MPYESITVVVGGVGALAGSLFGAGMHWGITRARLADMNRRIEEFKTRLDVGDNRFGKVEEGQACIREQIGKIGTKLDMMFDLLTSNFPLKKQ